MNRLVLLIGAGVVLVLAFVFLRPSQQQQAPAPQAAGDTDAPGAARNDRLSDAEKLRQRLAAAQPRPGAHRGEPGKGADTLQVDESGSAAEQRAALRRKAAGPNRRDVATGDGAAAPVYDSGFDRTFRADQRTELDAGDIEGPTGTVAFWIKPQWAKGSQDEATFLEFGDGALRFTKVGDALRFEYIDKEGNQQGFGIGISGWKTGEWHHVVGTWNEDSNQLFTDGNSVGLNQPATPPGFWEGIKAHVGTAGDYNATAQADITGVHISNQPSNEVDVADMFQNGEHPH